MTIKITELANLSAVYGNTLVPVVANVSGTLTTVKGDLDQLGAYIVSQTEANIVLANTVIKLYVDGQISAVNTSVTLANTIQSQQIASANIGIIGYIDQANTIQSQQIASANIGIIGYIDRANTIQSQQIASANIGIIGYIDQANTIQNAYINGQISAANAGVSSANLAMKGYVDNSTSTANVGMKGYVDNQTYSNVQASAFFISGLPTYNGNIGGNIKIGGNLTVSNIYVPALANSTGTTGQITYDSGYVYICVGTNTWKRANIATW